MMEDRLVTYKTACLAKEKGFPQSAMMYYEWDGFFETLTLRPAVDYLTARYPEPFTAAPTQSLLQRWLREEKKLHITINSAYEWGVDDLQYPQERNISVGIGAFGLFDTYEDALEDALKYVLENLL